jgi:hypothetical protein
MPLPPGPGIGGLGVVLSKAVRGFIGRRKREYIESQGEDGIGDGPPPGGRIGPAVLPPGIGEFG